MAGERKFNDGDRVRLRSGGPTMTVEGFDAFGEFEQGSPKKYLCRWFDGKGQLAQDTFKESSLEAAPDKPGATW